MKTYLGVKRAAFYAAVVISAQAQNLLQNPGFENWSGGMPVPWMRDDSVCIKMDNNLVHSGTCSARDSLITQNQERADFYQGGFAANPNTRYTFSAYVYDNDPAGRIRQMVSWRTAGGWIHDFSNVYSSNATSWQAMSMTALSPPGTDSALVSFRAYDSSSAWDGHAVFSVDDASFSPVPLQPPLILRLWHKPTNPPTNSTAQAYAVVCDDGTIISDTLYYGINGLTNLYGITHAAISGDTFKYQIPGRPAGDTVGYFIKCRDDDGLTVVSDTHSYLSGAINVRINEVYYDAPGEDSGCFIELYGPAGLSLDRMALVGVNGTNGADYAVIALDSNVIPPDGFFVCGQNHWIPNVDTVTTEANLQNGPDNVELRRSGITIDALGYGAPEGWEFTGEWMPAPDVTEGDCLGRYPDGHDSDNNFLDFIDYDTITPGLPNVAAGACESDRSNAGRQARQGSAMVPGSIALGNLINDAGLYPVWIYDCVGRLVITGIKPSTVIKLESGVYFLAHNGNGKGNDRPGLKLVVIR